MGPEGTRQEDECWGEAGLQHSEEQAVDHSSGKVAAGCKKEGKTPFSHALKRQREATKTHQQ